KALKLFLKNGILCLHIPSDGHMTVKDSTKNMNANARYLKIYGPGIEFGQKTTLSVAARNHKRPDPQ
ncbi:MAG: hypothetical protein KAI50_06545, partial [Desulfobacterales bacterium]|nr:hypothetical protein [Desulfobacterales bacterium]